MSQQLLYYGDEYRGVSRRWPYAVSSGTVVFRIRDRKLEVLLLKSSRRNYTSYHLPKGTVKIGEPLESAALRETAEEAGVKASLVGYLGAQYRAAAKSNVPASKIVHFYAARYEKYQGNTDGIYSGIEWMSPAQAITALAKIKVKREDVFVKRLIKLLSIMKEEKKTRG